MGAPLGKHQLTLSEREPAQLETRIPALDGLRGIAILLVLFYHFDLLPDSNDISYSIWNRLAEAGWLGVDLFFVLSGFLITGILLKTKNRKAYYKTFFARRVLRIFPLYYLFLACAFFVLPSFAHLHEDTALFGKVPSDSWPFWLYIPNLLFAQEAMFSGGRHLHVTWSLGIEEQFYLFWPFLIAILPRRLLNWGVPLAICTSLTMRLIAFENGAHWVSLFNHTLYHSDGLFFGALACLLIQSPLDQKRIGQIASWLWPMMGLLVVVWVFQGGHIVQWNPQVSQFGFSIAGLFFGSLLLSVCCAPNTSRFRKLFENRILQTYGKYSYGIYLTHVLVQHLLVERLLDIPNIYQLAGGPFVVQIVYTLLGFTLSLAVAIAIYHLYEKKFLQLKGFFFYPPLESVSPQNDSENQSKKEALPS
jgi:peptidoglycan/LPS O-acetylase OafA/YrhL